MREAVKRFDIHSKGIRLIVKFALLILYMSSMVYVLFFAERFGRDEDHHSTYNLIPMHEIMRYVNYADSLGWEAVCFNLIGNVVAFIPFGFIITSFLPSEDKRHPLGVTGLGLLFSVSVEQLQYLTSTGAADVDDIILNTLGGFIGYLLYMCYWRMIGHHE